MNNQIAAIQLGLPDKVKARLDDMGVAVTGVECTTFRDEPSHELHIRVVLTHISTWRSYCADTSITKFEMLAWDIRSINGLLTHMAADIADTISVAMVCDVLQGK